MEAQPSNEAGPPPANGSATQTLDSTDAPSANETQRTTAQPATQSAPATAKPPKRPMQPTRDRFNAQSLGGSLNMSIKKARVLMVGAGGIGCELLKNLVLAGFGEISIVDLDTIDLSNLNRQFLFRHEHIKKSKALVAKEVAQRFNPKVKIDAHHANIKDSQFDVPWFKRFTIVFNALDNLEARRHVNKMCLAADVPLVESGTTGFNGQVQVIKKGVTACYDCTPKETPKSFPVCTIRSTPSQPIHCIVWGKSYLLSEMFGASEDQTAFDHSTDADNAQEVEELKRESEALRKIRDAVGKPEFPQMLFDKVFYADIERLRSVEDMWKSRAPPEPLKYDKVMEQASEALASKEAILADGQRVWSLEESLVVFNDSIDRLSKRMEQLKKDHDPSKPDPEISFDKDDEDTLDFVAASANIRSTIFGIDRKSRFDIKQMAGNIIPAIATTNAIVAGLCVLQSMKILQGNYDHSKEVFLTPFAAGRLLAPDRSRKPNPECPVCGVFYTALEVDLSRATLKDVVDTFVKDKLGFDDKEFVLSNDVGILYDPDETDNLPKKLSELGIDDSSFLTVMDEDDDDTFVNVIISVQKGTFAESDPPLKSQLDEKPSIPRKPKKASNGAPAESNGVQNGKHSIDGEPQTVSQGLKRSRLDEDGPPLKKAKMAGGKVDDDVVVVEDAGGAIVID
ncbi:hypothetical protein NLU13_3378 [Sarocladium strictum]|uniref:Ubiquitin-activating enzyme E1-like n=1 Tax=Sarocladium strictum TaxID=5046 RepID=A0AA39GLW9_SARSR|nr:hypothetical protein NLU13_3378 [Sarocladium strictum]